MSVYTNCAQCHNSYPIGRDFDFAKRLCSRCRSKAVQEEAKTALADDLVRGEPRNSRDSDT